MVKQAFMLFGLIGNTSGRNAKLAIIRDGAANEVFSKLLYMAYNQYITYGVKKLPEVGKLPDTLPNSEILLTNYRLFLEALDKLSTRQLTGNAAKFHLDSLFKCFSTEESKWYGKVLQKDLKIGVTEESINAAWPDFIPVFKCQKAEMLEGKYPKRSIIDPKLDGIRIEAFREGNSAILRTSNGNPLHGYDNIIEDLKKCPEGFVYGGELITKDFNGTIRNFMKKNVSKDGILNLFNAMPLEDFNEGFTPMTELERRHFLYREIDPNLESIGVIKHFGIFGDSPNDIEAIEKMYEHYLNLGFEGLMLKDADAPGECKRGRYWQKIKPEEPIDLVVVDVEPGKEGTDREGKLGALVVDLDGNRVNVGGGYNKQQLGDFWDRRQELIGTTIEIRYQPPFTHNQDGGKSLRFPRFKRLRLDK